MCAATPSRWPKWLCRRRDIECRPPWPANSTSRNGNSDDRPRQWLSTVDLVWSTNNRCSCTLTVRRWLFSCTHRTAAPPATADSSETTMPTMPTAWCLHSSRPRGIDRPMRNLHGPNWSTRPQSESDTVDHVSVLADTNRAYRVRHPIQIVHWNQCHVLTNCQLVGLQFETKQTEWICRHVENGDAIAHLAHLSMWYWRAWVRCTRRWFREFFPAKMTDTVRLYALMTHAMLIPSELLCDRQKWNETFVNGCVCAAFHWILDDVIESCNRIQLRINWLYSPKMTRPTNKLNVTVKNVVNLCNEDRNYFGFEIFEWNQFNDILDICDILPSHRISHSPSCRSSVERFLLSFSFAFNVNFYSLVCERPGILQ